MLDARYAEALPLHERAYALRREALGEAQDVELLGRDLARAADRKARPRKRVTADEHVGQAELADCFVQQRAASGNRVEELGRGFGAAGGGCATGRSDVALEIAVVGPVSTARSLITDSPSSTERACTVAYRLYGQSS